MEKNIMKNLLYLELREGILFIRAQWKPRIHVIVFVSLLLLSALTLSFIDQKSQDIWKILMGESQNKEVLEKQVLMVAQTVAQAVEDKLDEEIASLDQLDLDDFERLRERRRHQMKKMAEKQSRWMSLGHGEYSEISEKDFFAAVKASERVVCHFYRENWPCKVLDKHLSILAQQHVETRFLKVHAEKSPFVTEKLRIVMLPTLALIMNAKAEDYVVGFDELGGSDEFSTEELEERLAKSKVIFFQGEVSASLKRPPSTKRSIRRSEGSNLSDDSD